MANKDIPRKILRTKVGIWRRHLRTTLHDKIQNDMTREEVAIGMTIKRD
jgi:hypothetical protein